MSDLLTREIKYIIQVREAEEGAYHFQLEAKLFGDFGLRSTRGSDMICLKNHLRKMY